MFGPPVTPSDHCLSTSPPYIHLFYISYFLFSWGKGFDVGFWRAAAPPWHELEGAREPTGAIGIARHDVGEELAYDLFVVQLGQDEAARVEIARARRADQSFNLTTQFSRLGLCRLQVLVTDQVGHEIADERE